MAAEGHLPSLKRPAVLPRHVAVVMDGNGRWAKKRHLPRLMGHKKGIESVRAVVQSAARHGISHLTLFAFSSENWARPADEVEGLMRLFVLALQKEVGELHRAGVRVRLIGDLSAFSDELRALMGECQKLTEHNTGLTINVCVNYGSRWEILEAVRAAQRQAASGAAPVTSEKEFEALLPLGDAGDVDLFIRTSGEQRISNFLLWQLAYSELYFTDVLWPDFGDKEFTDALNWFAERERRFGKISEQLDKS